jgi:serine/threonine protein kinase
VGVHDLDRSVEVGKARELALPRRSSRDVRPALKSGTVLRGRYRLVAPLESGLVATTYRAQDIDSGRTVDVKIFDELDRHEGNRVEPLDRPTSHSTPLLDLPSAFLAVHDCDLADDGRLYLVTEPVEATLADLLRQASPLEPVRALELAMWIGEAIEVAFNLGVTDLPLAPEDVIIDEGDRLRLRRSDVAILRRLGLADQLNAMEAPTRDPRYVSPEELAHLPLTERSIIYRFGVLIYELLCGSPPYDGTTPAVLRRQIRRGPPRLRARHRALPASLDRLTARMVALDPLLRPATLTPILNELWEALCRHQSQVKRPAALLGQAGRAVGDPGRRARARHLTVAVASIGAVVGMFLTWPYLAPRLNKMVSTTHRVGVEPLMPSIPGWQTKPSGLPPSTSTGPAQHVASPAVPMRAEPSLQAGLARPATPSPLSAPVGTGSTEAALSATRELTPPKRQPSPGTPVVSPPPPSPSQPRAEDPRAADPGAIIDWLVGETPRIGE